MKESYVAKVHFLEKEELYVTTQQAAEYVGKSAHSLEHLRHRKTGPEFIKTGDGRVLYRVSDLVAWYYGFDGEGVRTGEEKLPLEKPAKLDYDVHLFGDDVANLAGNIKEAVENIREEIFKNKAEGFLCFVYRCCKIKAMLFISDEGDFYRAKYYFTAE